MAPPGGRIQEILKKKKGLYLAGVHVLYVCNSNIQVVIVVVTK